MIGLLENCRGIRKKGMTPFIRDPINKNRFDFVSRKLFCKSFMMLA
jgi:hypothetical protein